MDNLTRQKLEYWAKKLLELEKAYESLKLKKGEAASDGDLSENAAYKLASEEAETYSVRIAEVKKIIEDLKKKRKS